MPFTCGRAPGGRKSLEVENQDSTVVWSGIPLVSLERVGLDSVCEGSKNQMDNESKINSVNLESD